MQACAEEARGQLPHINGKGGDCWVCCHYMCNKWTAPTIDLAATIVEGELQLVATIVDKRTSGAAPWMPIKKARF